MLLKGEGFKTYVKEGQKVKAGDKIIEFDKGLVERKKLNPVVIMIFVDDDAVPAMDYKTGMKAEAGKTVIGIVKA